MKTSKTFFMMIIMFSLLVGSIFGLFIAKLITINKEVVSETELLSEPVEFITNLKLEKGKKTHYIKSKICVSTYDESSLKTLNDSPEMLNDIYIDFFNQMSYTELGESYSDKEQIKRELTIIISNKLNVEAENVIFSQFIYE